MSLKYLLVAVMGLAVNIAAPSVLAQPRAKFEPSGNVVYHGASLPDVWNENGIRNQLSSYNQAAGKKIAVVTWFASAYENRVGTSWNQNYLPNLRRVKRLGAVSLIKFSTQDYAFDSTRMQFNLRNVAAGERDAYFREAASAVKTFASPVFISIDHEMNGTWYPYSQAYDKGATMTATDFVNAWRRIVTIFRQVGANNAAFVWSPNVPDVGGVSYKSYYPGDNYVDWIGVSLYSSSAPDDIKEIYSTYAAKKPFFITEWATSPEKNRINRNFPGEATWVKQFFDALNQRYPRVKAISWFNWRQADGDHRLQRVPAQETAYEQDVASPRYLASASNLLGAAPAYDIPPREVPGTENVVREVVPVRRPVPVAPRVVTPPVVTPPVKRSLAERLKLQTAPIEAVKTVR